VLVPGDSAVYLQARGDMVIAGAGDARAVICSTHRSSRWTERLTTVAAGWFTLWTDHTAINLTSAGGNMAPSKAPLPIGGDGVMHDLTDSWPAILRVLALSGNIYYGASAGVTNAGYTRDVIASSPSGELSILAAGSIYGGQRGSFTADPSRHGLIFSAAGARLPTPFDPAFVGKPGMASALVNNISVDGDAVSDGNQGQWSERYSLFAFGPNTAATAPRRDANAEPIRIYAVGGDIVGLTTGETRSFPWAIRLGRC
jgi:hypothetical protein